MTGVILGAALSFAFPPLITAVMRRERGLPPAPDPGFFLTWACGGFGGMAATVLGAAAAGGGWAYVLSFGASGAAGLVLWCWSRRKGARA